MDILIQEKKSSLPLRKDSFCTPATKTSIMFLLNPCKNFSHFFTMPQSLPLRKSIVLLQQYLTPVYYKSSPPNNSSHFLGDWVGVGRVNYINEFRKENWLHWKIDYIEKTPMFHSSWVSNVATGILHLWFRWIFPFRGCGQNASRKRCIVEFLKDYLQVKKKKYQT